jgi:hypothetical protein
VQVQTEGHINLKLNCYKEHHIFMKSLNTHLMNKCHGIPHKKHKIFFQKRESDL